VMEDAIAAVSPATLDAIGAGQSLSPRG